jgi:hypothetical protein
MYSAKEWVKGRWEKLRAPMKPKMYLGKKKVTSGKGLEICDFLKEYQEDPEKAISGALKINTPIIDLSNHYLKGEHLEMIIPKLSGVTSLNLSNNTLDCSIANTLFKKLNFPSLKILILNSTGPYLLLNSQIQFPKTIKPKIKVDERGIPYSSDLKQFPECMTPCNRAKCIEAVRRYNEQNILSPTPQSLGCLTSFTELLKNSKLETVQLQNCSINNEIFYKLIDALQESSITTFDVSKNNIDISHIGFIRQINRLQRYLSKRGHSIEINVSHQEVDLNKWPNPAYDLARTNIGVRFFRPRLDFWRLWGGNVKLICSR